MAVVLHKKIKVYDVNRFINRSQVRHVHIDPPPKLQFYKKAEYQFQWKPSHEVVTQKVSDHFLQRSLEIYSEIAKVPNGALIDISFDRILPGKQEWSYSETPVGILCIHRDGLEQFKEGPKLQYSEIDYELTQGYFMVYHDIYHKQINIEEQKDQITFTYKNG